MDDCGHQEIIERLQKEIEALKKDNEEVKRRLRIYENPHMPSSKQIVKEKKEEKEPQKRGAPVGHKGATRERRAPNRFVRHQKPKTCPSCKGMNVQADERKQVVEDIIIIPDVAEISYYDCLCKDCGKAFSTASSDLPKKGNFGPTITSLWASLHYIGTVPFERLSLISKNCLGMPITAAGLHNVIYRNAGIFEDEFDGICEAVRNSKYAGSDETRYSFNGKTNWLWDISTNEDVLVLIRQSRGSPVLEEVFGEIYGGILNSDCYSAYEKYKAKEKAKDWSHIIRDARDTAKHNHEGAELHKQLSRMYRYIAKAKKNKGENSEKTKRWIRRQKRRMKSWKIRTYESKAALNLVRRICKYEDEWFTCLKYDFVEPTNDAREREIRKSVLARKISGCHRSEKGKHAREIMMSNILTVQKRGQNPFEFIANKIRIHNLGGTLPN